MRNIILSLLAAALLYACSAPTQDQPASTGPTIHQKIGSATIYEVNIRQHTQEGTLNAFAKDLPRLKELGVQVLWIMPVQPIGVKNRKEPLGSYYSIQDYSKVNPEFGTEADFKNLVDKAHELGFFVILDWVPNHTAWDHPWITEHPDFYALDEKGNIMHEADWSDIALLNHLNPGTRAAMIQEMKRWVTQYNIDGFRCDHAGHEIPLYFWEEVRAELDPIKKLFYLAEWDGARMHLTFDGTYAWPLLGLTDKAGRGEANANDLAQWIANDAKEYGHRPYRLTMITNHDENSWHGTEFERLGDGVRTFATFIFTAYGTPMLYSGQEVGLNKRLKFFSKDTIDWSDAGKFQPFYQQLVKLHADNRALWGGAEGGMAVRINNDDPNVFAFSRTKDTNTVIVVLNFSGKEQTLQLKENTVSGSFADSFTGQTYELAPGKPLKLTPWQYLVFVK